MIEEWDLTSTNLHRARQRHYEVAVLPAGAIEPHNQHLPYGQDFRHTNHVAAESCRRAWRRCEQVLCVPTIPFGVDCNLLDFPLALHVSQATVDAMLRDLIVSLRRHGLRKFVLLGGHGGNDFAPFIRQVQCDLDVFVFLVEWWKVGHDQYAQIFEHPDDHAGEMETSVALALYPDLVEAQHASDGAVREFRFEALRKGWARTSRNFAKLSAHCAAGNPAGATAEKGRRYLDLVCGRVADFLVELAEAPIDAKFPFVE